MRQKQRGEKRRQYSKKRKGRKEKNIQNRENKKFSKTACYCIFSDL